MKQNNIYILILCILLASCQSEKIELDAKERAIQNVTIINVKDGQVQTNMTVIIRDKHIHTIGKTDTLKLVNSDKIVDGTGKYLIPGLWDMHVHMINEPYSRNVFYPLFIANGITGVRVMAADCYEPCEEPNMTIKQHRNLQAEIIDGQLLGPKSILGSYYVNGVFRGESSVLKPGNELHGRELAQVLKERGVDFIKIYSKLNPETYYGIAEEAKKLDLNFAGHVPLSLNSIHISNSGQSSIEHISDNLFLDCSTLENKLRTQLLDMFGEENNDPITNINALHLEMIEAFDSLKCHEIYNAFKKNNTWIVPTLRLYEVYNPKNIDWNQDPNIKYMPKEEYDYFLNDYDSIMRNFWGPFIPKLKFKRNQIIAELNTAGVGLLAGSDVGELGLIYGFSLHEELISLQNAGLTSLETLQTATLIPAKYQDATDSLGTVEQGKIADLILINENPLEDIKNTQEIEAVFTNGKYFSRKDLDSLLLSVENYIKNEN